MQCVLNKSVSHTCIGGPNRFALGGGGGGGGGGSAPHFLECSENTLI